MANWRLRWHTIRHLRPQQAWFYLLRRGLPPRRVAEPRETPQVRTLAWQAPLATRGIHQGEGRFRFLNVTQQLGTNGIDWCPQQVSRLWRYNLHYFDYLREAGRSPASKVALLQSWITGNPQNTQPGWEPFTTSLRIGTLFVCTANVCRSPTAEGVFRDHISRLNISDRFLVDSAGVSAGAVSKPPEPRATRTAALEGYELGGLRSRPFVPEDFSRFDYILCMDQSHLEKVQAMQPAQHSATVSLLLDYTEGLGLSSVPDPYYGGQGDFTRALALIEAGVQGLLRHIVDERF